MLLSVLIWQGKIASVSWKPHSWPDRNSCMMWVTATRLAVLPGRNKPRNVTTLRSSVQVPGKRNRGKAMAEHTADQNWQSCYGSVGEKMACWCFMSEGNQRGDGGREWCVRASGTRAQIAWSDKGSGERWDRLVELLRFSTGHVQAGKDAH